MEDRVLLLALRGRDAEIISGLLERQGLKSHICGGVADLAEALAQGAGAALITEESLRDTPTDSLDRWIEQQEPWSDFPFILLATKRHGRRPVEALRTLNMLGNVVVLERPIHSETLSSAVDSALRGRRRQYDARARLTALKDAEERLTQLNASLEELVEARTGELSRANNQLMQEVAERERAQAALAQAQKVEAIGQLTGGIAHDFNNLLTVISGNIELIGRKATDERLTVYADRAGEAAARATKLTNQLLAFSRTQQLALRPIELNALIEGMTDLVDRTIGPHVRKHHRPHSEPLWVMGDSNQLELAILNLAINARDAMPDGGDLHIEASVAHGPVQDLPAGAYGVVTVRDTGVGIPPHLLDRVLDPFFTTKPIGKGTGLGLSQVFGIARQSGGTAMVNSTERVGTSVSIWLPVSEVQQRANLQPAVDSGEALAGLRVLLVDDDDGVRRFMTETLQMLGCETASAASGEDGLHRLEGGAFDVLIVDFAMNGLNGAEVAVRAKQMAPAMPVVLATGYAEVADPVDAIDATLRKPFRIDDLTRVLQEVLGRESATLGEGDLAATGRV